MADINMPVALGGENPVRPKNKGFRRTPEVGIEEVLYAGAQINSRDWEPDARVGGLPIDEGLTLSPTVLEMLGIEVATFGAKFERLQALGLDSTVVPCNNGTHAIRIAFAGLTAKAAELGLRVPNVDGDEVIVPAATWQATAAAPLRRNLVPVLVDVLPGTLCMDPAAVRDAITDRTVGIIPVHLYNRMAAMSEILEIADSHKIAVVEDCAHAHGAVYQGKGAGTLGVAATFSFQGSKSLSTQEGGAIMAGHPGLVAQLCSIVTCGRPHENAETFQADNDRMSQLTAALGRGQIDRFPEQKELRVRTFAGLEAIARELPGIRPLDPQPEVDVPPTYKWPFRVVAEEWAGLSTEQVAHCLELELNCEVARIYKPLVDSPLYQPHSDPALRISEEHWRRIDPRNYPAPVAMEAYDSVLVLEHAVGLDPTFPADFGEAIQKLHSHRDELARELS